MGGMQGSQDFAKSVRVFQQYLNLLCRLLRHLSPHPDLASASGPAFPGLGPEDACEAAPLEQPLVDCLFDVVTAPAALPAVLQDACISGLSQLMQGFPQEVVQRTADVRRHTVPLSPAAGGLLDEHYLCLQWHSLAVQQHQRASLHCVS